MLTGMLRPTSGTAVIAGHDLLTDPLAVKRSVGFVPESGALYESLTGLEYLRMVSRFVWYRSGSGRRPHPGIYPVF